MARVLAIVTTAPVALIGCSDDAPPPPDHPKSVTMVTSGGFSSPTDAVASPDGSTFYFAARDAELEPAIFATSSQPGSAAEVLAVGAPLDLPIGLVLSCDGGTLYIADRGGDDGAVLAMSTAAGSTPADLGAAGVTRPGGLAMGPACDTVFATGRTVDGTPALFAIPVGGGAPRTVWAGEPLVAPTGVHVDTGGVAWVMDHLAHGANGEGVLFAIPSDGSAATEVISDLRMGTPGGVSLTKGGGTAVMPTRDADGRTQLTSVVISTGELQQLATPEIGDPAGLRTAASAPVLAVVDSETGAIYRAE